MSDPRYDITVLRFRPGTSDPVMGLAKAFGISVDQAENLVANAPTQVKAGATAKEAAAYATALESIGADVVLFDQTQQKNISVKAFMARRAASNVKNERAPQDGGKVPAAQKPKPLLDLEYSLDERPTPRKRSQERTYTKEKQALELDLEALPEQAVHADVPALPPVLREIEIFEAPGWTPEWKTGEPQAASATALLAPGAPLSDSRSAPASPWAKPGAASFDGRQQGRRKNPVVPIVIVSAVIGGIVAVMMLTTGVSSGLQDKLEQLQQSLLPAFELVATDTGSLGSSNVVNMMDEGADADTDVYVSTLSVGTCYAWIAATTDTGICDLDLHLTRNQAYLMADVAFDNNPLVFHCPSEDVDLQLQVINWGQDRCSYGLAHYETEGSFGWPLLPYLDIVKDVIAGRWGLTTPWVPLNEPTTVPQLGPGQTRTETIRIRSGQCVNVVAVAAQGNDLDLSLLIDGHVESFDEAIASHAVVGACAYGQSVQADLEFYMYRGSGNVVWQMFEGDVQPYSDVEFF